MASNESGRLKPQNAETLKSYYERANVGDFLGAVQTLSSDIVFSIPGDTSLLPFSGEWVGHDRVMELFRSFGGAFKIVYMDETRTITTEDEVISFNDESFKVNSTGQYYRVGVVHHIKFNADGLIKSLTNVHDTDVAVQAFSGKAAFAEPILPPGMFPNEAEITDSVAHDLVEKFCGLVQEGGEVSGHLDDQISVIVPGNPDVLPFSGVWIGKQEIGECLNLVNSVILDRTVEIKQITANNGSVAVVSEEDGKLASNGESVHLKKYELFQLTENDKIGRISVYLDTFPIAQGYR